MLPPDVVRRLAGLAVTVVTQPAFLLDRGDEYLEEVDAEDRPHLYRCAGLDRAGVCVGAGTDAPFGPEDPWVGHRLGRPPDHPVGPGRRSRRRRGTAAGCWASSCQIRRIPGGPPRTVAVGAAADLCLLGADLQRTLDDPVERQVVATVVGGRLVHEH